MRWVYAFREYLFTIFETAHSLQQAQTELKAWLFLVREQHIPGFEPFLNTLQHYWVASTNFFKHRLTSGFVEGLNNPTRVLPGAVVPYSTSPISFNACGSIWTAIVPVHTPICAGTTPIPNEPFFSHTSFSDRASPETRWTAYSLKSAKAGFIRYG